MSAATATHATRTVSEPGGAAAISPRGREILRAVMPAVLGTMLPEPPDARARALERGLDRADDYIAHLSLPLQNEARRMFALLASMPARLVLLRTPKRWSAVPAARIETFLVQTRGSRLYTLRRIYAFLQALAVIAWFDLPESWEAIGYPGPPVERPDLPGAPS